MIRFVLLNIAVLFNYLRASFASDFHERDVLGLMSVGLEMDAAFHCVQFFMANTV